MSDPVSWLVIEPGWRVVAADGSEVGRVEEVIGDTRGDIFNGIAVATGLFKSVRYVPAEHVAAIEEGEVALSLTPGAVEALSDYEGAPPSEDLRPR